MGNELVPVNKSEKPDDFVRQREALHIPPHLQKRPVLYLQSHRGAFDVRYKGHKEAFLRILQGEDAGNEERESVYFDCTESTPEEIVQALYHFITRTTQSPARATHMLPAPGKENMVPPAFICNVVYLPPIEHGRTIGGPSTTFAIDGSNYRTLLPELAQFLREKRVIPEMEDVPLAIVDRTRKQLAFIPHPDEAEPSNVDAQSPFFSFCDEGECIATLPRQAFSRQ